MQLGDSARSIAAAAFMRAAATAAVVFATACSGDSSEQVSTDPGGAAPAVRESPAAQTVLGQAPQDGRALQPQSVLAAPQPEDVDTSGWVLQPPFYAAGDEPYWRLEILDGWFVFRRSGLPEIEAPLVQPDRTGGADVFASSPLEVRIRRGYCETLDGEASNAGVIVVFDGGEFEGCGFDGQVGGPNGDLIAVSTQIADQIAPVDACLQRLGEPALVTGIYAREGDRTAVGMRTVNGSLYECAVESDDATIAFLDPIEPGVASAWMTSRMRFLRAGVPLEEDCESPDEVRDPGGDILGLLLPESCKF